MFSGFPDDFFGFFSELRNNNNRDWFAANKARYYESVVGPMGDYITSMAPHLHDISRFFRADPRPHGGSMFRIYRDTRFSADKTPYKTHAASHFRHRAGSSAHAPGFYMQIDPEQVSIGGGIWRPPAKQLGQIRSFIADNPVAWEQLTQSVAVKDMGGIQGDALKRPPRGYDTGTRHIEDIKRKSFFLMENFEVELALGPQLVTESARVFRSVASLNNFVSDALGLPF